MGYNIVLVMRDILIENSSRVSAVTMRRCFPSDVDLLLKHVNRNIFERVVVYYDQEDILHMTPAAPLALFFGSENHAIRVINIVNSFPLVTINELHSLFMNCPNLVEFKLHHTSILKLYSLDEQEPADIIELPHLKRLELHTVRSLADKLHALFALLKLSPSAEIHIVGKDITPMWAEKLLDTLCARCGECTELRLEWVNDRLAVYRAALAGTPDCIFSISMERRLDEIMSWRFQQHIKSMLGNVKVFVTDDDDEEEWESWAWLFDSMLNTEILELAKSPKKRAYSIGKPFPSFEALFEALKARRLYTFGARTFFKLRLPKLTTVELKEGIGPGQVSVFNSLLACYKTRSNSGRPLRLMVAPEPYWLGSRALLELLTVTNGIATRFQPVLGSPLYDRVYTESDGWVYKPCVKHIKNCEVEIPIVEHGMVL
ncbi:unnamed protein product [Peniophora sp. CBMAI 1063]|nr:unnamed protein product [Peniophora sp. CBMAI 1063]